ncbi:MAG: single-stranded DNA-binding protein [Ectothiorhodospiraceae bacterium]|nr:single-stranded DNA-binding protein [Chromatiales bacterium]MCP5156281.1 single-stranded DNA-binding protein [Ectothiorhodospiraceae bacterium]
MSSTAGVVRIARNLGRAVGRLSFAAPVTHVYNPLDYAWATHRSYLERYGCAPRDTLLLGMNPGPFGMVQTGVPFGDVELARDWLGITGRVTTPVPEHPKRPVLGFDCPRGEVSGRRLWGWARERFGEPERFFARYFVWNYCPLAFMEESGRNRTPDKLAADERAALYAACDDALRAVVEALGVRLVVGIGRFAADRATAALGDTVRVGVAPHPSPASPIANRGWAPLFEAALAREEG